MGGGDALAMDKDLVVIPGVLGTQIDPSAADTTSTKGGIDATKPMAPDSYAQRIAIPKSVLEEHIHLKSSINCPRLF